MSCYFAVQNIIRSKLKSVQNLLSIGKMSSNSSSERLEMLKQVQEVTKLDPEALKKVEGWEKLWENNMAPWHKEEIHPHLTRNLQTLIEATGKSNSDIRFFVPLCGKTKDLLFLKSKGFQVIGCEGVEKAILDFFTENSLDFIQSDLNEEMSKYASKDGKLEIVKGDYFKLTPELLGGKIDCVWDRGSLVAIDVAMRPTYAEVMMSLLNDKFGYLLATLQRDVEPESVIPHSASFDDVKQMFGHKYSVHLMGQTKVENGIKDNLFVLTADKAKGGHVSEDRLDMWRQRWDNSNTGWHKTEVNPHLLKFFDYLKNGKEKIKILFPLSGKCLDLVHCYNEGHTVIGIEGVPLAVEEMFRTGGIEFSRTFCQEIDGFIYKSLDSHLVVFACDFYKMKWELLPFGKVDAVFDRGAFEAIDVSDREAYIEKMLSFVKPECFRYILNCFHYQDPVFNGPPRPFSPEQISKYFEQCIVEVICNEDYSEQGKIDFGVQNGMRDIHYLMKPKINLGFENNKQ